MSEVKPRMAIAYHFFKDFDTTAQVYNRIRKTYDGPLSLAEDFMVWNVTKDDIKVRMAVTEEHTWSPPLTRPAVPPGKDDPATFAQKEGTARRGDRVFRLHRRGQAKRRRCAAADRQQGGRTGVPVSGDIRKPITTNRLLHSLRALPPPTSSSVAISRLTFDRLEVVRSKSFRVFSGLPGHWGSQSSADTRNPIARASPNMAPHPAVPPNTWRSLLRGTHCPPYPRPTRRALRFLTHVFFLFQLRKP
jgi:hypothetical protein